MELWLIADTNLFLECKALDQLPWEELNHDPVVILLTKPVLDEIDKHKKGSGRTRERAIEIYSFVRSMLTTNIKEVEIRATSPRVLLRLEHARPDPDLQNDLDYGKNDERLVGIVSTMQLTSKANYVVKLFTDDTGPASTASGLGLPFQMIESSWRRPPAESTEAKKIRDLQKDLATYRAQEPVISIKPCENASEGNVLEVTRRVTNALTNDEIDEIIVSLHAKHPLRSDLTPPAPSSVRKASGEIVHTEYLPPLDEAVAEYREAHPRWLEACRDILRRLHQGRDIDAQPLVVQWPMSNIGTRPARQVRVEFEAKGPLKLFRHRYEDEAGESNESPREGHTTSTSPVPISKFPSPPSPPPFRESITRRPPPARPKMLPELASSALHTQFAGHPLGHVRRSFQALQTAGLNPASRMLAATVSASDAARLLRSSSVFESPTIHALSAMPAFSLPFLPPPHDPEAFYWDWPEREAVKTGALTCDLWRHQTADEVFEFEVLFDRDGEARGTVECTVHAENLTEPVRSKCIIGRVVEHFSVREIAEAMVEACS